MSENLTEEDMRCALFGGASPVPTANYSSRQEVQARSRPSAPTTKPTRSGTSKLRVILHVSKEYEGEVEVFVHDVSPLSTLLAEQEAKAAAMKKTYKYMEVVSVKAI
jgi:hypothetical protein